MDPFATFQSSEFYLTNPVGYFRNSGFTEAISGSYWGSNLPCFAHQELPVQFENHRYHRASVRKQHLSPAPQM